MKKRYVALIMALTMVLSACASTPVESPDAQSAQETTEVSEGNEQNAAVGESSEPANLIPVVAPYSVNEDFSNVVYASDFAYLFSDEYESEYNHPSILRNALIKNNFAVTVDGSREFFDIYEDNRYVMFPNFITVDSLMHTYHLYFAHLMKKCEQQYLSDELKKVSSNMLAESAKQYEELKGTDWENAAFRNLAFFYVGSLLQDESVTAPVSDPQFDLLVKGEYDKVMAAEGIEVCALTDLNEDYTQYKPRGYYDGDDQLEHYFRAMMWYGRIAFELDNEEMAKSAILQTIALSADNKEWSNIYEVTSFFAGKSDDAGFQEIFDVLEECCSEAPSIQTVTDEKTFKDSILPALKKINPPAVNSIPVYDGEDPIIPSYRFMGQRFTIDAAIMQRLIYSSVKENPEGERRNLPDTLDTAAVLGSEKAYEILDEQGDTKYENYNENIQALKAVFNNDEQDLWNASLYSGWLYTLRPLFEEKRDGYPSYMQSEEWDKKNLETFAGSYAELKHDTILYTKQPMAEMGGPDFEPLDDRGYVDTQPVVYSRFKALSEKTKEMLSSCNMLSDGASDDLDKLSEIAGTLITISEKELTNDTITDDEYEFIRCYGGYIEHFWEEVTKDSLGEDAIDSTQAPCPVIADIATDPNGSVLEVGSGYAATIYVVFPIDGELHVGRGSAYSFYQFTTSITDRMTDEEWKNALSGGYLDDEWNWVEVERAPEQPSWTQSYRIKNN